MTLDFENPPINEVAVGLFFQPITALRAEHIGALWGTIRDQFPNSSQNPPLLSPGQTSFSQLTLPGEVFPLPRFWFISADETNLLQLQRDAFFFNWRRRESDYPRFKSVLAQFEEYFSFFVQFARQDLGVTTVTPTAFELTYVNIIGSLESVSSAAEYSKVVPQLHLPKMTSGAKNPNEFNHFDIYQISDNFQLVVTHRSVATDS